MINLIKKWQEKRRRKRILKIIKDAKQWFIEGREGLMCLCFAGAYPKFWNGAGDLGMRIQKLIPEFNRETLGATTPEVCSAWWDYTDRESRIKAFDKLIEIYDDTKRMPV